MFKKVINIILSFCLLILSLPGGRKCNFYNMTMKLNLTKFSIRLNHYVKLETPSFIYIYVAVKPFIGLSAEQLSQDLLNESQQVLKIWDISSFS